MRQKWLRRHRIARKKLQAKHKEALDWLIEKFPAKEQLASSAIGLLMLGSLIPTSTILTMVGATQQSQTAAVDKTKELLGDLGGVLPSDVRPLSGDEEAKVSQILSQYYGASVKPDIGGLRLNRTYGVIGAEQHLVRFPGDSMAGHVDINSSQSKLFNSSGMAPGRGAWGYFADSKAELDQTAIEREKWYVAVQTFAAPNYNERLSEYRDFFKYRKMLVVNPENGQAVVADIADSGPAIFTGKHLGGSPEVMYELGLAAGPRRGAVLYFFVDDADDKIPLGPVNPMGLPNLTNEKN